MITITENATAEIEKLLIENAEPFLRIAIQGGGCSGFSYAFDFDQTKNEDDFEFPLDTKYKVVIDAMSMQYLQGAEIDYKEDITGSQFVIKNPNAQSTCGCGSSFSVWNNIV